MSRVAIALALILSFAAHACGEVIRSFDVEVRARSDASLEIVETIAMDFENARKHGIHRLIPTRYRRYGNAYTIGIRVKSVTDAAGTPHEYTVSRAGGTLNITIGDRDVIVTGEQVYRIHYTVRRAVNFQEDGPEIYWNATGNEWPYAIEKASTRFYPPEGTSPQSVRATGFRGGIGSTERAIVEVKADHVFVGTEDLRPAQGLTMVAGLPPGSIHRPTAMQEALWWLRDWWAAFAIPMGIGGFVFYKWRTTGRDEGAGGAIPVEWNPPDNITPAEVGALIDERADMPDIVAMLIDLAARGHLRIEEIESSRFLFFSGADYLFERLDKPADEPLLPHERRMLDGLFARRRQGKVKLSELKEKFHVHLPEIRRSIYRALVDRGYFLRSPDLIRAQYYGIGVLMLVFAGMAVVWGIVAGWIAVGIGLAASAIIVLLMARAMPAKTLQGTLALRQCLGFQRFVELTEAPRIRMMAKDDPAIFGRLLPYAMVLGVADAWAEAFEDLLKEPPDWYRPHHGRMGFSSHRFLNDLGRSMTTMSKTFASKPRQSRGAGSGRSGFSVRGGFSGGGFGGGGGRSW